MRPAPPTVDEVARLDALRGYRILDTEAEQVFDDLTQLAAHICGTPVALVSLIDEDRQWFKSRVGLSATETPRDLAFCAHAIHQPNLFVVGNALEDERFADNPLVTGDPSIRFYAGAPLVDPHGHGLGTLCVIDRVPRVLTGEQAAALEALSRQVVSQLELRKTLAAQHEWNGRLEAARQDAEEANRTKSRFLAQMSHELRTPLNAIIGFANVIQKRITPDTDERVVTYLNRIAANGSHLLHLINEILDLAKIEAGRVEVEPQAVDLGVLIDKTVTQLDGQVPSASVSLLTDLPRVSKPIMIDPERLKQVLINLIGNALKFTEKGQVTVRLCTETETHRPVAIEVQDTGIGISKDRQVVIFEAFRQADESTSRKYGGTGLGLPISLSLLKLLACEIELESAPGEGATFRILLPRPSRSDDVGVAEACAAAASETELEPVGD